MDQSEIPGLSELLSELNAIHSSHDWTYEDKVFTYRPQHHTMWYKTDWLCQIKVTRRFSQTVYFNPCGMRGFSLSVIQRAVDLITEWNKHVFTVTIGGEEIELFDSPYYRSLPLPKDLSIYDALAGKVVWDVGTGAGIVAAYLDKKGCEVYAYDVFFPEGYPHLTNGHARRLLCWEEMKERSTHGWGHPAKDPYAIILPAKLLPYVMHEIEKCKPVIIFTKETHD